MNRLLVKKCVYESALLFIACATMLFAFCWIRVWIVCQFDLQKFEPLLEQFRMFEKFAPVPLEQLLTYAGTIGMSFSEPVLILCILVWCIARGSDVVSGELGRGTLEMLLSRPISRTRLMLTHASVCIAGLVALCGAAWLGLYVGIHTNSVKETISNTTEISVPFLPFEIPFRVGEPIEVETPLADRVSPNTFTQTTINLFGFGFFVLGLSTLLSSLDRYRWRTIGLVISLYVIQLLIFLLSKANVRFRFLENVTFLSSYQPDAIVNFVQKHPEASWSVLTPDSAKSALWPHMLGPLGVSFLLLGFGCVFFAAAVFAFRRRDLPAPL